MPFTSAAAGSRLLIETLGDAVRKATQPPQDARACVEVRYDQPWPGYTAYRISSPRLGEVWNAIFELKALVDVPFGGQLGEAGFSEPVREDGLYVSTGFVRLDGVPQWQRDPANCARVGAAMDDLLGEVAAKGPRQ